MKILYATSFALALCACAPSSNLVNEEAAERANEDTPTADTLSEVQGLTVMSWNIANLASAPGQALRGGYVRTADDYALLKSTIEAADPDIVAFQEIASRTSLELIMDSSEYAFAFESRCEQNATRCRGDADEIYTAIAYRHSLAGVQVFQIDELSIPHTNECLETRPVRGGVGVKLSLDDHSVWIPSLHMKATCKDDKIEPGTEDDCATQKIQFDRLVEWMSERPAEDTIILAGDFNRKLLESSDSVRTSILSAQPTSEFLPSEDMRSCWSRDDVEINFGDLKRQAFENNPDLEAQGIDPFLYMPSANREIDFFVVRDGAGAMTYSSDQIELGGHYRLQNPGSVIRACDGETIVTFEGSNRALTFSESFPSDHCPIVLNISLD